MNRNHSKSYDVHESLRVMSINIKWVVSYQNFNRKHQLTLKVNYLKVQAKPTCLQKVIFNSNSIQCYGIQLLLPCVQLHFFSCLLTPINMPLGQVMVIQGLLRDRQTCNVSDPKRAFMPQFTSYFI